MLSKAKNLNRSTVRLRYRRLKVGAGDHLGALQTLQDVLAALDLAQRLGVPATLLQDLSRFKERILPPPPSPARRVERDNLIRPRLHCRRRNNRKCLQSNSKKHVFVLSCLTKEIVLVDFARTISCNFYKYINLQAEQ